MALDRIWPTGPPHPSGLGIQLASPLRHTDPGRTDPGRKGPGRSHRAPSPSASASASATDPRPRRHSHPRRWRRRTGLRNGRHGDKRRHRASICPPHHARGGRPLDEIPVLAAPVASTGGGPSCARRITPTRLSPRRGPPARLPAAARRAATEHRAQSARQARTSSDGTDGADDPTPAAATGCTGPRGHRCGRRQGEPRESARPRARAGRHRLQVKAGTSYSGRSNAVAVRVAKYLKTRRIGGT